MHDGQSELHLKGRTSDKRLDVDLDDAEDDSTDEDEDSRGLDDKIVGGQKKKRISKIWTREESRIIYQVIEIQKLKEQEGLPCLSGSERFAIASAQLKEKGYSRSDRACSRHWYVAGRMSWNYSESPNSTESYIANRIHKEKVKADKLKVDKPKAVKKTSPQEVSAHKRPRPQSLNLVDNDRSFNVQTGSALRDTNIPKKPRLDEVPTKASANSHKDSAKTSNKELAKASNKESTKASNNARSSIQSPVSVDKVRTPIYISQEKLTQSKNHLPEISTSTPPQKPVEPTTPKRKPGGSDAPIEIDSSPLAVANKAKTTSSSHKNLYSFEFKRMMLTEYRKIEEKLAASAERKKKLQEKILAHQARAELERKAAEASQKEVDVEEKLEASLRGELGHFKHFIG
ncbi:hypothetical protein EAF04_005075 [Stromatinia cepivora]|nr:hypothetical protein EAF04_005075 [Stromatinia cepivora]